LKSRTSLKLFWVGFSSCSSMGVASRSVRRLPVAFGRLTIVFFSCYSFVSTLYIFIISSISGVVKQDGLSYVKYSRSFDYYDTSILIGKLFLMTSNWIFGKIVYNFSIVIPSSLSLLLSLFSRGCVVLAFSLINLTLMDSCKLVITLKDYLLDCWLIDLFCRSGEISLKA
jgi:hypothetical protein